MKAILTLGIVLGLIMIFANLEVAEQVFMKRTSKFAHKI